MAHRPYSLAERIEKMVSPEPNTGCWLWVGHPNPSGYGILQTGTGADRRGRNGHRLAHRASYETFVAPIPDGLCVLHKCDVRACVNPRHLYLGTNDDNVRDRVVRGRNPNLRGERGPAAKVTAEQVREARALRAQGCTYPDLARQYGVTRQAVWQWCHRITWVD